MKLYRFVVMADRVRGFDTQGEAERYALANYPSVLCERVASDEGRSRLVERARHDFLYDPVAQTWRIMLG